MYELLQGRVLFRGRPGPKDAWTAEEDQLAQTIELFGPIPASVREMGKCSSKYFDQNGKCLEFRTPCDLSNVRFRRLVAHQAAVSLLITRSFHADYKRLNVDRGLRTVQGILGGYAEVCAEREEEA